MASDQLGQVNDNLFAKWQEWIELVYSETITLFAYRSFYRGIVEMTQSNDQIPASSFFDALGAWYATTQVVAVRRQADLDARAVSLATLLSSMGTNPSVMTRSRFSELFTNEDHWQAHANEQFDRYAGARADEIAPERYQEDLDRFQEVVRPIKKYVDRMVAHNDQRELQVIPTYEELNQSIDLLEELLNKYMVLLKATSVPNADPVHQADWRAAFRVPWLRN